MRQTDQSLLEQLQISDIEVEQRKALFAFEDDDIDILKRAKPIIDNSIDAMVSEFYEMQTSNPEISLLIGDQDTLQRLANAQRGYILDLFRGVYDLEYVNNRLRIGLVHKRIGVEPKLYLSAVHTLKSLINATLSREIRDFDHLERVKKAVEKLMLFDVTLVFDTYIRSLLTEIEIAKAKSDQYALSLAEKVRERTRQLEEQSRKDPLTGLLNVRHLIETLVKSLRAGQRRSEPVSLVYIDIDDFKLLNDTQGHQRGDEILRAVGRALIQVSRAEDSCFRYGGDEFCVILPNCDEATAHDIYRVRLLEEIEQAVPGLRISIGIAQTGPEQYQEPEKLLKIADRRMYEDKKAAHSNGTQEETG